MPVILTFRWRQKVQKFDFKASLEYMRQKGKQSLKKKKEREGKNQSGLWVEPLLGGCVYHIWKYLMNESELV